MTTDKEYIEKMIKNYRRRNRRAASFAVIGAIFCITAYIVYVEVGKDTHQLANSISSGLVNGEKITDIDIKLVTTNNDLLYVMGMRVGQMVTSCLAGAGSCFGYCLYLLFGSRKERIMIGLYEKTKI